MSWSRNAATARWFLDLDPFVQKFLHVAPGRRDPLGDAAGTAVAMVR